jgi:hypothetical protein
MGFFIRRSFSVGPFRFNLSKSGVGVSAGVKGLRIGTRPDGKSYVTGGRGGLYFRQNLDSPKPTAAGPEPETVSGGLLRLVLGVLAGLALIAVVIVVAMLIVTAARPAKRYEAGAGVVVFPTFAPTFPPPDPTPASDEMVAPAPVVSSETDGSREWKMPGGTGTIRAGKRARTPTATP